MAEVFYNGNKVNNSVQALKTVKERIPDLSSRVKGVTSSMVSCKGFELISAGVSNSSFSGNIDKCSNDLNEIISNVETTRRMILDYNNEGIDREETYEKKARRLFGMAQLVCLNKNLLIKEQKNYVKF